MRLCRPRLPLGRLLLLLLALLPATQPRCYDDTTWEDYNGFTCNVYAAQHWCDGTGTTFGVGWNASWGMLQVYANATGTSAVQSCCQCASHNASVDCMLGPWGDWGDCRPNLNACVQTRNRTVLLPGTRGGKPCESLTGQRNCSGCSLCTVTDWSAWSACDTSWGYRVRSRAVNSSFSSGALCAPLGDIDQSSCVPSVSPRDSYLNLTGLNEDGQLGVGDTTNRRVPTAVLRDSGLAIRNVSLGLLHTLFLHGDLLHVTGANGLGQLGLGDDVDRNRSAFLPSPDGQPVRSIAAGSWHSAFITAAGALYVFGSNDAGQLGLGHQTMMATPQRLSTDIAVVEVALGGQHSAFRLANGSIYTTGKNDAGQLGLGDTVDRSTPAEVGAAVGLTIQQLALGGAHSAFLTAGGALYMFGSNDAGQLGLNTSQDAPSPQQLSLSVDITVTAVALGLSHSAFVTATGALYIFGSNDAGQLGIGRASAVPVQLAAPDGLPVVSVAVGGMSSAFITSSSRDLGTSQFRVYTFGSNGYGQLGLGDEVDRAAPTRVTALQAPPFYVYVGGAHTAFQGFGPTRTPTPSPTSTATPVPTKTVTPTATEELPPCPGANLSVPLTATLSFSTSTSCYVTYVSSWASNSFWTRGIVVVAYRVTGRLVVELTQGCSSSAAGCPACDDCRLNFTAGGQYGVLTFGTSSSIVIRVATFISSTGSVSRAAAYSTASATAADLAIAQRGTALFLGLSFAGTFVLSLLVSFLLFALYRQFRGKGATRWKRNVRLAKPWVQVIFIACATMMFTGMCWLVIVLSTSDFTFTPPAFFITGACVLAIGGAATIVVGLWAFRDPVTFLCPACGEAVSRWRFVGTYTPADDDLDRCQKAHTAHLHCVHCDRLVVVDRWRYAPCQRPVHRHCWETLCLAAVDDPRYMAAWWAQQAGKGTAEELVHLLAFAVRYEAEGTMAVLLEINPELASMPVAQEGGTTPMHLAARLGNLPALQLLLQVQPYCLDPVCMVDPGAPCSLSIRGLNDETNDVYVLQPYALYNDRPFYIGAGRGQYLYFYEPTGSSQQAAGWAVTRHLGSPDFSFHLPLPDPRPSDTVVTRQTSTLEDKMDAPPTLPPMESSPRVDRRVRRREERDRRREWLMGLFRRFYNWVCRRQSHHSIVSDDSDFLPSPPMPPPMPQSMINIIAPRHAKNPAKTVAKGHAPHATHSAPHTPAASVHGPHRTMGLASVTVPAEAFRMDWLPHTASLLQEAVSSGEKELIKFVADLYTKQDPACICWHYHCGHYLWQAYPWEAQAEIQYAMEINEKKVSLTCMGDGSAVDLGRRRHIGPRREEPIRGWLRPVFQFRRKGEGPFTVTSDLPAVLLWDTAVVVCASTHLAMAAPDLRTLTLLLDEGIVDFALWTPPCRVNGGTLLGDDDRRPVFTQALAHEVRLAMGLAEGTLHMLHETVSKHQMGATMRHLPGRETGIGSRLMDGLQAPTGLERLQFYPPGYASPVGTLPFCADLPDNEVGLHFQDRSISQMALDALLKISELQRQGNLYTPRQVVAVYVYTYELNYDEPGFDQIYATMNRAMRLAEEALIAFYRPLIWEMDQALHDLPSFAGKSYRGIDCRLDSAVFAPGNFVRWPSFSSASQNQAVAEEFAKGDSGTLFFLSSANAKSIADISRFPEEQEVLFLPNTTFEVTSVLTSTSEIGAFYGRIDNIAMSESGSEHARPVESRPRLAGYETFLLHLPTGSIRQLLHVLATAGIVPVEALEAEGVAGELVALPTLRATAALEPVDSAECLDDGFVAPFPSAIAGQDLFPTAFNLPDA
eukprot:EG_transcript_162